MAGQNDYELKVLLELRERARDEAQDEVAVQVATLEQRKKEVRQAELALREAVQKREQLTRDYDERAASGGALAGQLYNVTNYLRGLRADEVELAQKIEEAKKRVVTQQQCVDDARNTLVKAATELEAVLSHHQQWSDEQRILNERKQSSQMDDIAARLWRENQS